jgi:hypothetical protein
LPGDRGSDAGAAARHDGNASACLGASRQVVRR